MKKILFPIILLMLNFTSLAQGLVYIDGTVTDLVDSLPVVDHPVTILADSVNGITYYNIVFTDSSGYYYDQVPVMTSDPGTVLVQTSDCKNVQQEVIFTYDSVNTSFTHHFRICTLNSDCEAYFNYFNQSDITFQFLDLSLGNPQNWYWIFGDGTFSDEQNPFHLYPGPGTYEVCLFISGDDCSDEFCEIIVISDTIYKQLYGQVFAGNFPLQSGMVTLFAQSPAGGYFQLSEGFPVDSNGIYFFSLVPEGTYLIQVVPDEDSYYLPTYFGDVINWQQASQILPGKPDNPYNINLVLAGQITPGPGSISGYINSNANRTDVDKITMILMDDNGLAIDFSKVNNQGLFEFQSVEFGTYFLRAELSGVYSDNMKIDITAEKPHMDVILTFSGNSILDVEEMSPDLLGVRVFPNPVSDRLKISFRAEKDAELDISIFSIMGQQLYRKQEIIKHGDNFISILFDGYPAGIYTVNLITAGRINFVKKIVKIN